MPPCLPGRHLGRRGVRGLSGNAPARGTGTFSIWTGHHVLHARCVVETLEKVAAPVLLRCPAVNYKDQNSRRDALESGVQADPCLHG